MSYMVHGDERSTPSKPCETCGKEKCDGTDKYHLYDPSTCNACHGSCQTKSEKGKEWPCKKCGSDTHVGDMNYCASLPDEDVVIPHLCFKDCPEHPTPSRVEGYGVAEARIDRNLNSFRALPRTPEIRDEDILELRRWMLADVIEHLLSSRQSAIEEAIEAVGLIERRSVICHPDDRCEHRAYNEGLSVALSRLRLLREESEDKKGV